MKGLRTQESEKFLKFFAMVQAEAERRNAVFFADCGEGRVFENDSMECEDMSGWLIPKAEEKIFEPLFMSNSINQHGFDRYRCYVDYNITEDNGIAVRII